MRHCDSGLLKMYCNRALTQMLMTQIDDPKSERSALVDKAPYCASQGNLSRDPFNLGLKTANLPACTP